MLNATQLRALQNKYREELQAGGDVVVYLVFVTLYMPMTSEMYLSYRSLSRAEADEEARNGYKLEGAGDRRGVYRTEYTVEEHLTSSEGRLYRDLKIREEFDREHVR